MKQNLEIKCGVAQHSRLFSSLIMPIRRPVKFAQNGRLAMRNENYEIRKREKWSAQQQQPSNIRTFPHRLQSAASFLFLLFFSSSFCLFVRPSDRISCGRQIGHFDRRRRQFDDHFVTILFFSYTHFGYILWVKVHRWIRVIRTRTHECANMQ